MKESDVTARLLDLRSLKVMGRKIKETPNNPAKFTAVLGRVVVDSFIILRP